MNVLFKRGMVLIAALFLQSAYAEFAVINDPDGFTNVRSAANATAPIRYAQKVGDVFFCLDDLSNGYYSVVTSKSGSQAGDGGEYIHKSRVKLITSLPKLAVTRQVTDKQMTFSGYGYVIDIRIKPFNAKNHKIIYGKDSVMVTKLDEYTHFWGADKIKPLGEYEAMTITYDQVTTALPLSVYGDLFNPYTDRMSAYYEPVTQNIYVRSSNGDGAGSYDVVLVFNHGKYVKRLVVLSEYV